MVLKLLFKKAFCSGSNRCDDSKDCKNIQLHSIFCKQRVILPLQHSFYRQHLMIYISTILLFSKTDCSLKAQLSSSKPKLSSPSLRKEWWITSSQTVVATSAPCSPSTRTARSKLYRVWTMKPLLTLIHSSLWERKNLQGLVVPPRYNLCSVKHNYSL